MFKLSHVFTKMFTKYNNPVNINLFKVSNRSTRKNYEICLKLIIKTLERCQ